MVDIYSKLADIYPYVMRNVRYDRWTEYLYLVTREFVKTDPEVLELAAGNCTFTRIFSQYYDKITASDISLRMLRKGDCLNNKVCCDMLHLPFKTRFDLIYSTFDSINYLTSKVKLLQMFKEVRNILSEDGIFTFDASMELNSIKHAEDAVRRGKYNGFSFIHTSQYNTSTRIHKNIFSIIDKDGKKFREVHKQMIYPFETYFELIPKAGLYVVCCYKAFSFVKGNSSSERLQFIVKKAQRNALV